jgi:hypothetical protein
MASISAFLPHSEFDDATTKALDAALDDACNALYDAGLPPQLCEAAVARRIITAARKGERDVERLSAEGVAGLFARSNALRL